MSVIQMEEFESFHNGLTRTEQGGLPLARLGALVRPSKTLIDSDHPSTVKPLEPVLSILNLRTIPEITQSD